MTEQLKTQLRIPADLHQQLVDAAKSSGRSMNAEMVQRLQDSFRRTVDDEEIFRTRRHVDEYLDVKERELEAAQFGAAGLAHLLSGLLGAFEEISKRVDGLPDIPYAEIRASAESIANTYQDAKDAKLGNAADAVRRMREEASAKRRPKLFEKDGGLV